MGINTKGKDYIIDLSDLMHKVELYNLTHYVRVDSYKMMLFMMQVAIHNNINVIENDPYYRQIKSDELDELIIELIDDFYLHYGLGYGVDYTYAEGKLISYNIDLTGEMVLCIRKVVSIVHEDLDDLLGDGDVT